MRADGYGALVTSSEASAASHGRAHDVFWEALSRWPRAYCWALHHRVSTVQVVDRRTDVVVEGFPRSSNSFVRESLLATEPALRIASHVHQPAHVRQAVRLNVPTLVLVRDPMSAVVSMLLRDPHRRPADLARWYIDFHREAWPVAERVHLVGFEAATQRFADVLALVSSLTGRSLGAPPVDLEEQVFARLEAVDLRRHGSADELHVARPSAVRRTAAAELTAGLNGDPALAPLVREAEDWYQRYRQRPGIW